MSTMTPPSCELDTHGRRQLELKLTCPVSTGARIVSYALDWYVFTPHQLHMSDDLSDRLMRGMSVYTRYTAPDIPLDTLRDPACERSPLTRLAAMIDDGTGWSGDAWNAFVYEARTLVNDYHARLRLRRRDIFRLIDDGLAEETAEACENLITVTAAFLDDWRDLRRRFIDADAPQHAREELDWADEALSLDTEKQFFRIHFRAAAVDGMERVVRALGPALGRETAHRRREGYPSIADPDDPQANELLVHRESMLKKWAQSALYMDQPPSGTASKVVHAAAAVAAAVAMALALAGTLLTNRYFPSNSVPWLILVVLIYVFKDRAKELTRRLLLRMLPHLVADDERLLVDPKSGKKVGRDRARLHVVSEGDAPDHVVRLRNVQRDAFQDFLPPEQVVRYHKNIRIRCRPLMAAHERLESITQILRLDLGRWLSAMDDPDEPVRCLDADGRPVEIVAPRVYHLNVVVVLAPDGGGPCLRAKRRVCANRDGVVRIETIDDLAR